MKTIDISKIDALAELPTLQHAGGSEYKLCCPFHADHSPSCQVNVAKNVFKCQVPACGAHGDIVKLIAKVRSVPRSELINELNAKYDIERAGFINPSVAEEYHNEIWKQDLRSELYKRGVTDDMIRLARLGFHNGRLTIPVYDHSGFIVNIRHYLPGAPGPEKMKNTKGYGGVHLYLPGQLEFDTVWICGGEMKALVATQYLNKHRIGAVSVTAGEGNWAPYLSHKFKGKRVFVCYDVDNAGVAASRMIAAQLQNFASSVWTVQLPLDREKFPKGDINDWVASGATDADFMKAMGDAVQWLPLMKVEANLPAQRVTVAKAASAENMERRVEFEAVVTAMDTTPYIVPKQVGVTCTKDQPGCSDCPVYAQEVDPGDGMIRLTVRSTALGLLEMIGGTKKAQRDAVREGCGIPRCKPAQFTTLTHYNITDLRLAPQLSTNGEKQDDVVQAAFVVDHRPELNTPYVFRGSVHPSPKNQQAILIMDEMDQAEDNLSSFHPPEHELEQLKVFQTTTDEIYEDLEANVTRIFHRRDLHLAVDLCYHSPLSFNFDDRRVNGWVNILLAGDSSQGKSETTSRLMEHYGLGERVDCKAATAAGLQGGLTQIGQRWFVQWGAIPTHDRRLVILEEIKGAPPEVLAQMTDMRSSGVAQLTKIEKRKTNARTRLIFISNPRSGRSVSAHNFGVEVIKELMGGLEDIRRLDLAMVVCSSQVDAKEINRLAMDRPAVGRRFTPDLCRRLVLWAWTRTPAEVVFTPGATEAIMAEAVSLSNTFSESMPLVDRGTMRHKLARLSAALAARLFSTDDLKTLIVKEEHVKAIATFINRVYSDPVMGYLDFSRAQIYANQLIEPEAVRRTILGTKFPKDLAENLLYATEVAPQDIGDWCDLDRDEAQKLHSFFIRKHALFRSGRVYLKTTEFITLLKKVNLEARNTAHTDSNSDF